MRAAFPAGVLAPVQYGPAFRSFTAYRSNAQLIPHDQLARMCQDLFGQPLSVGTVQTTNQRL